MKTVSVFFAWSSKKMGQLRLRRHWGYMFQQCILNFSIPKLWWKCASSLKIISIEKFTPWSRIHSEKKHGAVDGLEASIPMLLWVCTCKSFAKIRCVVERHLRTHCVVWMLVTDAVYSNLWITFQIFIICLDNFNTLFLRILLHDCF